MHTTYITVAEFIANGGTLTAERPIYSRAIKATGTDGGGIFKPIGWYDPNTKAPFDDMVSISKLNRSFAMISDIVFVEVSVTPIYK